MGLTGKPSVPSSGKDKTPTPSPLHQPAHSLCPPESSTPDFCFLPGKTDGYSKWHDLQLRLHVGEGHLSREIRIESHCFSGLNSLGYFCLSQWQISS